MKLQEAIEHLKEKLIENNFPCEECREEHEQLLDWLYELQNWRETGSSI